MIDMTARLEWTEERVTRDLERAVGKGIAGAAKFLASRIEEAISRPAPTRQYITASGKVRLRATVRAVAGAYPRVVSGALKKSIGWELVVERMAMARIGVFSGQVKLDLDPGELEPWEYGSELEGGGTGPHPFIVRTLEKFRPQLEKIVGGEVISGSA